MSKEKSSFWYVSQFFFPWFVKRPSTPIFILISLAGKISQDFSDFPDLWESHTTMRVPAACSTRPGCVFDCAIPATERCS